MKNTITNRYLPLCSLAMLLAVGGGQLSAQQAPKSGFGVSVSGVNPGGDGANLGSTGFGVGAFWQAPFTNNLSGRIGADYVIYGGKDYLGVAWKMNQLGASYDLLFDLSENLYVLGGVGYYKTEFTATATVDSHSASVTDSENKVGFGLGAGLKFGQDFGLEAKYIAIGDCPRAQLSLSWRF
jgi:opacity protein-like surface antigen